MCVYVLFCFFISIGHGARMLLMHSKCLQGVYLHTEGMSESKFVFFEGTTVPGRSLPLSSIPTRAQSLPGVHLQHPAPNACCCQLRCSLIWEAGCSPPGILPSGPCGLYWLLVFLKNYLYTFLHHGTKLNISCASDGPGCC